MSGIGLLEMWRTSLSVCPKVVSTKWLQEGHCRIPLGFVSLSIAGRDKTGE